MSKNQVIWTTRCKVRAKYISIYFDVIQQKWFPLVSYKAHQKQKLFREGSALDKVWPSVGTSRNAGTGRKKCFFQKKAFFLGLRFSLGHFGQKAPES